MTYQEFLDVFLPLVQTKLPPEMKTAYHRVRKNNDVELVGLCLTEGRNGVASPLLYMENFYEEREKGADLLELAEAAAKVLTEDVPPSVAKIGQYRKEDIESRVVFRPYGTGGENKLLSTLLHRRFLDFAVGYAILLDDDKNVRAYLPLTNNMAKEFHLFEEEIFRIAKENSKRFLGESLRGMDEYFLTDTGEEPVFYVLTNRNGYFGAAAILYSEKVPELSEKLGKDLYLIPSSIHELLVKPKNETDETEELLRIVRTVNREELQKEDVLSDAVYIYRRESGQIEVFTEVDNGSGDIVK